VKISCADRGGPSTRGLSKDLIAVVMSGVSRRCALPNAMQRWSSSAVAICIVRRRKAVCVGSVHGCLDPLMRWSPPYGGAPHYAERSPNDAAWILRSVSTERRNARKGIRRRVRSQRGVMLLVLGWGLDRWVVKRVSRGRLLLHRCVRGSTIPGIRVGAMND
jgi:hypothetical protein